MKPFSACAVGEISRFSLIDPRLASRFGEKGQNRYRLFQTFIIDAMNRTTGIRLLTLLTMITVIHCHAQHMNEKDSPCPNAVTTLDMARCFSEARGASDGKLTALYHKLLSKVNSGDADRLTKVQGLWAAYREANCSAERALYQGGSAAPVVYVACLDAMTRARTEELQQTYAMKLKE